MENKYFKQALSQMVSDAAYGDAIRHMYDSGLSVDEIYKTIDYPVSIDKIESVIKEYEMSKNSEKSEYTYVEQQDEFGRRSFVRVKK